MYKENRNLHIDEMWGQTFACGVAWLLSSFKVSWMILPSCWHHKPFLFPISHVSHICKIYTWPEKRVNTHKFRVCFECGRIPETPFINLPDCCYSKNKQNAECSETMIHSPSSVWCLCNDDAKRNSM